MGIWISRIKIRIQTGVIIKTYIIDKNAAYCFGNAPNRREQNKKERQNCDT